MIKKRKLEFSITILCKYQFEAAVFNQERIYTALVRNKKGSPPFVINDLLFIYFYFSSAII